MHKIENTIGTIPKFSFHVLDELNNNFLLGHEFIVTKEMP